MGASAFLLFVLPGSPMAQPRAVIGGSFIAALVGVASTSLIQETAVAAPVAVGVAILVMFYCIVCILRRQHWLF